MLIEEKPTISTYRNLTKAEIDVINRCKKLEAEALALAAEIATLSQSGDPIASAAEAERWREQGKHDIQVGFMKLVRAIAKPQPL